MTDLLTGKTAVVTGAAHGTHQSSREETGRTAVTVAATDITNRATTSKMGS
jgi:hypothetical protein